LASRNQLDSRRRGGAFGKKLSQKTKNDRKAKAEGQEFSEKGRRGGTAGRFFLPSALCPAFGLAIARGAIGL
jgi:hypothetical protein